MPGQVQAIRPGVAEHLVHCFFPLVEMVPSHPGEANSIGDELQERLVNCDDDVIAGRQPG